MMLYAQRKPKYCFDCELGWKEELNKFNLKYMICVMYEGRPNEGHETSAGKNE